MTEDVYAGQVVRIILKRQDFDNKERHQQNYACRDEQYKVGSSR